MYCAGLCKEGVWWERGSQTMHAHRCPAPALPIGRWGIIPPSRGGSVARVLPDSVLGVLVFGVLLFAPQPDEDGVQSVGLGCLLLSQGASRLTDSCCSMPYGQRAHTPGFPHPGRTSQIALPGCGPLWAWPCP